MPDSMGKRQRRDVKARKAMAIEERRRARNQRKQDRDAGLIPEGTPIVELDREEFGLPEIVPESASALDEQR
jgi:hypothetical protein